DLGTRLARTRRVASAADGPAAEGAGEPVPGEAEDAGSRGAGDPERAVEGQRLVEREVGGDLPAHVESRRDAVAGERDAAGRGCELAAVEARGRARAGAALAAPEQHDRPAVAG